MGARFRCACRTIHLCFQTFLVVFSISGWTHHQSAIFIGVEWLYFDSNSSFLIHFQSNVRSLLTIMHASHAVDRWKKLRQIKKSQYHYHKMKLSLHHKILVDVISSVDAMRLVDLNCCIGGANAPIEGNDYQAATTQANPVGSAADWNTTYAFISDRWLVSSKSPRTSDTGAAHRNRYAMTHILIKYFNCFKKND